VLQNGSKCQISFIYEVNAINALMQHVNISQYKYITIMPVVFISIL